MYKTIFVRRNFLILTLIIVILILFTLGFYFIWEKITRTNNEARNITSPVKKEPTNEIVCTRDTRLENEPKFDRALSLVYEKVRQGEEHRSVWTSYNYFPAQLTNCIKVETKNVGAEIQAEGYFDPNSDEIKPNYFPIYIDYASYNWADDLVTALLLTHEITHVQQYIMRPSCYEEGEIRFGDTVITCDNFCLNDEVSAFHAQLLFLSQLNDEEKKSLNLRIQNDEELHPQLKMIQTLQKSLNSQIIGDCEVYNHECIMRKINWKILTILEESGIYDEQCGLD